LLLTLPLGFRRQNKIGNQPEAGSSLSAAYLCSCYYSSLGNWLVFCVFVCFWRTLEGPVPLSSAAHAKNHPVRNCPLLPTTMWVLESDGNLFQGDQDTPQLIHLEAQQLKPPQVGDFGYPPGSDICSAGLLTMAVVLT
jgi:hypothetical protein